MATDFLPVRSWPPNISIVDISVKNVFAWDRMATMKKSRPHEFVFEALGSLPVVTRPMFGCLAIYVGEKIVLMLRQKETERKDNGVWIAVAPEHHETLRREFPN